jgi:hypothetical protein
MTSNIKRDHKVVKAKGGGPNKTDLGMKIDLIQEL